jgi:hypothetical protein
VGDPQSDERRTLVGTRWVHVDGDDDARGAVFRDARSDLAPSRRPKEYLEFTDDNVVRRLATGPDDRAREVDRTTWTDEDGHVVFRFDTPDARGASEYQIVESAPDRLIIRR